MTDDAVPELRSKAGVKVAIAAGALAAIAVAAAVVWLLFGRVKTHTPGAAEKKALADAACPKVTASHFYKIEKDGKTSWLLGTRHAGVALAKYPQSVADAFKAASTAVFESIDDGKRPPPPAEADVADQLGRDDWAKYRELVGDEMAERVRHRGIMAATTALALLYEDTSQKVDYELMDLAKAAHKQLVPLEDNATTEHLAETYVGADTLRTGLEQITRRELLANEVKRTLVGYCTTAERAPPGGFDKITNERTRSWVGKLVPMLEQGNVFVAVGVDHVDGGTLDLGNLLAQQGFTVTRQ